MRVSSPSQKSFKVGIPDHQGSRIDAGMKTDPLKIPEAKVSFPCFSRCSGSWMLIIIEKDFKIFKNLVLSGISVHQAKESRKYTIYGTLMTLMTQMNTDQSVKIS
ncbi:MAG: hypothetical protein D4R67_08560 [Bacteroidetes bacterium]|nr:MAG: hypothetical protein D4R67_08560 [Bacteroidota bacterium]